MIMSYAHACKKRTSSGFAIIIVYVDDMILIGTLKELRDIAMYLKSEFEM